MLNFRKLKQDFAPQVVKEGKSLHEKGSIVAAKILQMDQERIRLSAKVKGHFDNIYESEIEIDRFESKTVDSTCDCSYTYDCQHLAALLFHLEDHIDEIIVNFSKEVNLEENVDDEVKEDLRQTFEQAASKHDKCLDQKLQEEILAEYVVAAELFSESPFFLPQEQMAEDKAELAMLFTCAQHNIEVQLALRLPFRSKPLHVVNIKDFLESIRHAEPLYISGKRYFFTAQSFELESAELIHFLLDHVRYGDQSNERLARVAEVALEAFGGLLGRTFEKLHAKLPLPSMMPCLHLGSLEMPLKVAAAPAHIRFEIEFLQVPTPKILLKPLIILDGKKSVFPEEGVLLECAHPGFIYDNTYYHFGSKIKRMHLRHLERIRDMTIPEPLFGTFLENALPQMQHYSDVQGLGAIQHCTTLPYVGKLLAKAQVEYINEELDVRLSFLYDNIEVPASSANWTYLHASAFITSNGILARNLTEEKKIIDGLFADFIFDAKEGRFLAKTEKKIVEFMTEVIPRFKDKVEFLFPSNLLDQFVYDQTTFTVECRESPKGHVYEVDLKVHGALEGVKLELLLECLATKKSFLEIENTKGKSKGKSKILVLNLENLAPVVAAFDEIGLGTLQTHIEERPLWSLVSLNPEGFSSPLVTFSMTSGLKEIQAQILGGMLLKPTPVPKDIKADLRRYQVEGIHWLEKLRKMHLNGILADDMGLGKTVQAIAAITQMKAEKDAASTLIVCPTSLLYNWKAEIEKFNPTLKVLLIDGTPASRKKLLAQIKEHDLIITTYTLLQKDVEIYKDVVFSYMILDEAQHIKNRGTRNAKSVKQIQAKYRLVLTGTPVENSLEELWSLFDFLMPGFLGTFDRFVERYVRNVLGQTGYLEALRKKVAPFILRRMKEDVLQDLPPVSEIIYYCHLSEVQKTLYTSYAATAKEELSRLVQKEGFDKVQIHVLATLTRLKQICCHPAIFAKEEAEEADSAKYDLLLELLQSLIEGNHKTVVFSQYTKMLAILREDLVRRGISFSYLDGSSKNRLEIVNQFNEDSKIPLFLVSLKAGGSGLNIVGADTVIHYDMWWNPAVENQATDRVHRMGQKKAVSAYKLITLGTIEEKIMNMQNRKKGLVKKIVSCDDEAMAKLTWEEVLELLGD